MLPPMPFFHDLLWFGLFAGLALAAWKAAVHFELRLSDVGLPRLLGRGDLPNQTPAWFATSTARSTKARSSGNTAFDEWRDGELARIEQQRRVLETRLRAFEGFVEKLKRAQDRVTFERFMAEHRETPVGTIDENEHRPA